MYNTYYPFSDMRLIYDRHDHFNIMCISVIYDIALRSKFVCFNIISGELCVNLNVIIEAFLVNILQMLP